jgi:PLP dependent protein
MTTLSSNSATTASGALQPPAEEEDDDNTSTIDIARNMQTVRDNIQAAIAERDNNNDNTSSISKQNVRLVAVSKTKPISLLQRAYDEAGCRVFGENYVQELVEKVPLLLENDNDDEHEVVYWHYIGSLQSNKVNFLLSPFLPTTSSSSGENPNNLHRLIVEAVDSIKLARKLNSSIERSLKAAAGTAGAAADSDHDDKYNDKTKLKVFVQINTSGEASKSGVSPPATDNSDTAMVDLCREIVDRCPNLHLQGLMTIGAPGDVTAFDSLVQCRDVVQNQLADSLVNSPPLELSMGMSDDYEVAIRKGSTNVRVGSSIFGARDYSKE